MDADGRSSLDGLYACGEVTSTGAHGANRLASNSLLEAVVFAGRIAEDILLHYPAGTTTKIVERPASDADEKNQERLMPKLRKIMSQYVGVSRSGDGLREAIKQIDRLEKTNKSARFRNALTTAKMAAVSGLLREESRGGHQRSDFPNEEEAFKKRSFLTLAYANKLAGKVLDGDL